MYANLTMDNPIPFSLADLLSNPKFNFLNSFNQSNTSDLPDSYNDVNDNPYDLSTIKCTYMDENQFATCLAFKKKFSFMSLNIQSISSKFSEFSEFIYCLDAKNSFSDVILLQETWKIVDTSCFSLRGYSQPTFKSRSKGQGGGVGLYFKNGISYNRLDETTLFLDHVIESLAAEITLSCGKKIAVVSLYRPASGHPSLSPVFQFDQFIELFANLLSTLQASYSELYFFGDFNINILNYELCEQAQEFIAVLRIRNY